MALNVCLLKLQTQIKLFLLQESFKLLLEGIPSGVNQILTENDNFLNVTYMRDDGSYRIYAQNGVQLFI